MPATTYKPTGRPRGRPLRHEVPPELERAEEFARRAAAAFEVSPDDIRSPGRGPRAVVMARSLLARALRRELDWTLQEIVDFVSQANHTSVWAGIHKASGLVLIDKDYAERYAQITAP